MHVEEYEARKGMIRNMEKYYEKWKLPSKEYRSKLRNCIPSDDEDSDLEEATSESRTDLLTNIMPMDDEDEIPSTSVSRESPPCSECDKQKKLRKSVTDCKKCSKCKLKESTNENINDLDLEEVLNETIEMNNIMPMDNESTEKPESKDSEEDEPNKDDVTEHEADNETTQEEKDNKVDKEMVESKDREEDEPNKDNVTEHEVDNETTQEEKDNKVDKEMVESKDSEPMEQENTKSTETEMETDKQNVVNSKDEKNIMPKAVVPLVDIALTSGFVNGSKSDHLKPKPKPPIEEEDETSSGSSPDESAQEPPKKKKELSEIGEMIRNVKADRHGCYNCPKCSCHRDYGTKRALHRHIQNNHSGKQRFHCINRNEDGTDCIKHYASQQLLNQHIQGEHGPGFEAYCGDVFKWPNDRRFHQDDCHKCAKYM